jgi:uncharacterized protein YpbB|tara:strand:- start:631 stop:882 length:252 start_codon:yes stop_codon:yes gene_type:complete
MSEKIVLTWSQWYNGFTKEQIEEATCNVLTIKNKILQISEKLDKLNDYKSATDDQKNSLKNQIKRLEMSKDCIIEKYGINLLI